jgi:hypothetical protein
MNCACGIAEDSDDENGCEPGIGFPKAAPIFAESIYPPTVQVPLSFQTSE